jgi:hypothetical protein
LSRRSHGGGSGRRPGPDGRAARGAKRGEADRQAGAPPERERAFRELAEAPPRGFPFLDLAEDEGAEATFATQHSFELAGHEVEQFWRLSAHERLPGRFGQIVYEAVLEFRRENDDPEGTLVAFEVEELAEQVFGVSDGRVHEVLVENLAALQGVFVQLKVLVDGGRRFETGASVYSGLTVIGDEDYVTGQKRTHLEVRFWPGFWPGG